ncbi:CDP-glycerol glycerophosphotransferase family protein [Salinicoccus roseus]|uniref:CDP-glycerol glycerophosphotransferase family protein n=1 Tax=Salinicoccus roseus TaxID=45670 RepID=UPI002301011E|nr:CDP-glycerol glycerophosphotransferase family protein [Salinicoccus roseus]
MKSLKVIALKLYKLLFWSLGKSFHKDHRLIMFESFLGRQYSDNPRALYEYMSAAYPDYRLMWSVDRRHKKIFKEMEIPYVTRFTPSWIIYMNKATLWITNSRLPLWIPKPKDTTYLQTWHGTPLKRLGTDIDTVHMPGTETEKYKRNFTKESSKWDYLISPNRYSTEIFRRAFAYDRPVLETGYPRNDHLFVNNDSAAREKIRRKLRLPLGKKIIFYAPTWRDDAYHARGRYKFDLQFDVDRMQRELSDDYVIILRLHYLIAENLDLSQYEGFLYDFSKYEDIRDLYVISDVLVTDYSSVFFDYAVLERPMIFYTYDIDNYRDKVRGFYFDFEQEAPGPLVKTTDGLLAAIRETETLDFNEKYDTAAFRERFCALEDGQASKRVSDEIICHLKDKIV